MSELSAEHSEFAGARLLLSKGKLAHVDPDSDPRGSRRSVFMRAFLVAVTNPKGYLFVGASTS